MYSIILLRIVPDTPSSHLVSILSVNDLSSGFPGPPDSVFMISTAYYPYPVSDKPSARRAVMQPHIYSPSESHHSPRNAMYPPHHVSGSPSPNYIYPGYDHYYSKDSWLTATPSSWPTFYPHPPRSLSLPDTALNPKVIVNPPEPAHVSDVDTPSSISSHSVLTPSSPFAQHDVDQMELETMDFDEFDCEEDYVDSDFADEMEGVEEASSPLYGASAPHVIKSTSALEGALGDTPPSPYDTPLGVFTPADRRLSASVPGYPSASHRSAAGAHQRWIEGAHPPSSHLTSSSSSTSLFAPSSPPPPPYNHMSSSSLAGAFASSVPLPHASRPTPHPLPILQPQPIRPIPPIPLAELTSSANEDSSSLEPRTRAARPLRILSPLPLLCQPVSDAIRYQLKERPASGNALGDHHVCYDGENPSICQGVIPTTEAGRFAQGLAFCQEHQSSTGPCSVGERVYTCGGMPLPIRWQ